MGLCYLYVVMVDGIGLGYLFDFGWVVVLLRV